ncbi:hypothetical protein QQM79_19830 [Marinobacteraceae bacterium S3BR75-40.1]
MKGQQWDLTAPGHELWEDRPVTGWQSERAYVPLDRHDLVKGAVYDRLCQEVEQLERRIETLRASPSSTSAIVADTYERMIENKRAFMQRWDMQGRPTQEA